MESSKHEVCFKSIRGMDSMMVFEGECRNKFEGDGMIAHAQVDKTELDSRQSEI